MPKESATNHSYIHTNTHTYTQIPKQTHIYKNTLKRHTKIIRDEEKGY